MRLRQIAPVGLVLALTLAGFLGARALGQRDARRDSERRAEVAAAQIRGHVIQGAALAESLRRFMVGVAGGGVTKEQFEGVASRWLSPAGLAGAAWIERVPASRRATYERRIGHPIVTPDRRGTVARVPLRSSYLPATLVSGVAPMVMAGLDLGSESGMIEAVNRERTLFDVSATPLATLRDGTRGFFLVKSAQRLGTGGVEPGFLVLFVPELWLRAAATDAQTLQLTVGGGSSGGLGGVPTVRSGFTEAGQRFEVVVPRRSVHGAAAAMPWIILVSGFVLALLVAALGINAVRRASARRELDRIFSLSHDLVTVADFDGRFRRVNPAVESILGYAEEEFILRPYLDFVHPDDRERTAAHAAALSRGQKTVSFENRFVCKDGSHRWLEWTATPVVEERVIYGIARDVTERRQAATALRAAEQRNRILAEEQAALRRVATLVARGVPPQDLFAAVTEEAGQLLPVSSAVMGRYEPDGMFTTVAAWAAGVIAFPVGGRWIPEGNNVMTMVFETGRPARIDDLSDASGAVGIAAREAGYRSTVGTPIIVDGRLWGVMTAASSAEQPLPADTEARLASFTELVATAIANTESRAALGLLADEQAALRRVATLVARGLPSTEIFAAVAEEVGRLVSIDGIRILRYEADGTATVIAGWGKSVEVSPELEVGARLVLEGDTVSTLVFQTGRPVLIDSHANAAGPMSDPLQGAGFRSGAGAPIIVEARLWGVVTAGSTNPEPLPSGMEFRLAAFTELVAVAIANAEGRAELTASRARIVAASDDARRRIERDLHDGAQQRLVSLALDLRAAGRRAPSDIEELTGDLSRFADDIAGVLDDLREMSRGIHPAILAEGGLGPALKTLARRAQIPVQVDVRAETRLPAPVEVAAYYAASEALTNAVKHAQASVVRVTLEQQNGAFQLSIRDDGIGGADLRKGSGLIGLHDRVEALGGSIDLSSALGEGTLIVVAFPLQPAPTMAATVLDESIV